MSHRDIAARLARLEDGIGREEFCRAFDALRRLVPFPWPNGVPAIPGHRLAVLEQAARLVLDLHAIDQLEGVEGVP